MAPSPFAVVVGLDFTDAGGYALDQAARVARGIPSSQLHLVHVFEDEPSKTSSSQLVERLRQYANEKASALGGMKGMTIGIHLRVGKPDQEIARLAAEVDAQLIVLGSRSGPDLKSWLVGSTSDKLIESAPCPVLVAGPKAKPSTEQPQPTIEPPCPDCLAVRRSNASDAWWCERHEHHAKSAHVFSYRRELPFATHDSEVIPTGIKF